MISPFVGAKVIEKFGSLRFLGIREGLWAAPGWPTIHLPQGTWPYPSAFLFAYLTMLSAFALLLQKTLYIIHGDTTYGGD